MIWRIPLSRLFTFIFISAGCLLTTVTHCTTFTSSLFHSGATFVNSSQNNISSTQKELDQLNASLIILLTSDDTTGCRFIVDKIIQRIETNKFDDKTLSESYYLIGVYFSFAREYHESLKFLNLSAGIKEKYEEYDERYAKSLFNISVAYNGIGDFYKFEEFSLKALEFGKKVYGEISPELTDLYINLVIANIELREYEKAINYSNIAITIGNNNPDSVSPDIMADLYSNLGVCYSRLADFSKAKIYLDKSESIFINSHIKNDDTYINLMNSLAVAYRALGLSEKSNEYFETVISLAVLNNSSLAYNLINSYAIILGNSGKEIKGEALLSDALSRAKSKFGEDSRTYSEVLSNYADYLREYKIDNSKSLVCYARCMEYLKRNSQNIFLKNAVFIGYSLSLDEAGEFGKALETIQSLLFSENEKNQSSNLFDNPGIERLEIDKNSLKILRTKYKILWDIYKKSAEKETLEAASSTAELIVSLLDKVRINISEEDSRLVLGDRYRDSYLNAIRDFNLLYTKTADRQYLVKAFEYAEKSKVAGLLTSTRELKAAQFHIPSDIADSERKLQKDISLFNALIAEESARTDADTALINKWKENLFETTMSRDSMILIFEKEYPDYYAIKYNTNVTGLDDISEITGRNGNYINYVVSDTILYIFVANRKQQQLVAVYVDSSFNNNIRQFRNLLSSPIGSVNARQAFQNYKLTGYKLYKTILDPVRKYLISDKLLISPDNILSYLPFEALPTSPVSGEGILYRNLHYLMDDFDISYTYSATFMAETKRIDYSIENKVIAFAPNYPEPIDIKSVLMNRQVDKGVLHDLPYARQEAEFVSDITGGDLFLNEDARESVFKKESGKYDIIHLAMHTVLNDKDPMHSTLIFSPENDTIDDRYLKTYEIYGIPLKAKMVVLSSCNTGTGLLFSGEGILSLARGFIYSGSQSVVMSMWEIEDRSGTEIVKMFYQNLKKGNSKSIALRKARKAYLKKADQLRSHPYFWSTLVIYGNNASLYYSKSLIFAAVIALILVFAALAYYFRKRIYS